MDERAVISWSWEVLGRSLAGLLSLYGWGARLAGYIPRPAWRSALAQLRLMEAAARRLLIAMAGQPGAPLQAAPAPRPPAPRRRKPAARSPAFTYGEPPADPLAGLFPAGGAPSILAGPALSALVPNHSLAARLAVIARILDAPERAAADPPVEAARRASHRPRRTACRCPVRCPCARPRRAQSRSACDLTPFT